MTFHESLMHGIFSITLNDLDQVLLTASILIFSIYLYILFLSEGFRRLFDKRSIDNKVLERSKLKQLDAERLKFSSNNRICSYVDRFHYYKTKKEVVVF